MQEMEQLASVQGLPTDRNTLNKLMALQHHGLNNQMGHSPNMAHRGALSGPAQVALALSTGYQNLLRQNSINSNSSSLLQEGSSVSNSAQSPSVTFHGSKILPSSSYSSPNLPQQQRAPSGPNNLLSQNPNPPSQENQTLQQQMIQQFLQDLSNNSGSAQAQVRSGVGFGNNISAPLLAQVQPASSNISGQALSRSSSFKGTTNSGSSVPPAAGNSRFDPSRAAEMPHSPHVPYDIMSGISQEFTDNGFFGSDLDDTFGFGWKA